MDKKPFDWKMFCLGVLAGLVVLLTYELYLEKFPNVEVPEQDHSSLSEWTEIT